MEEIILNVVSNSIKYTNPHGKITVSIDELDSEDEKNANYKVVVEDNGIGMSQDYLPHIFEEFSRNILLRKPELQAQDLDFQS